MQLFFTNLLLGMEPPGEFLERLSSKELCASAFHVVENEEERLGRQPQVVLQRVAVRRRGLKICIIILIIFLIFLNYPNKFQVSNKNNLKFLMGNWSDFVT